MINEQIAYDADGQTMHSWFFCQESAGVKPAVLVFPEAFGLGDHAMGRAKRLAELGYAALACDVFGNGRLIDDPEEAFGATAELRSDRVRLRARSETALGVLAARPEADGARIAAIGYCFGGLFSLELARSDCAIKGAVAFHGGLSNAGIEPGVRIGPRVLACVGADDPAIPAEQRASFEIEMRDAQADWQMHVYGGVVHSFTNPEADRLGMPLMARYDASADARSWAAMRAFFDEIFERK